MIVHHTFVGDEAAPHLGFILHGVLGAGHNFRSFAKRLTDQCPHYRFALLDLRYHGKSVGAPPPHTLSACADDLFDLATHLGKDPTVVIGHSLGGKVALEFGRKYSLGSATRRAASASSGDEGVRQIWALDSDPGPQSADADHQVRTVLASIMKHTGPFESRDDAIQAIVSEGLSTSLANWLATNLERKEGRYAWRLELPQIDSLLNDYFSVDLWPYLEEVAAENASQLPAFELLVAAKSDRWSGSMRERAEALPHTGRLHLHVLPDAGHWVHVDNPDGLLDILVTRLPAGPDSSPQAEG